MQQMARGTSIMILYFHCWKIFQKVRIYGNIYCYQINIAKHLEVRSALWSNNSIFSR